MFCITDESLHIRDTKYGISHVSVCGLFQNKFPLMSSDLGNIIKLILSAFSPLEQTITNSFCAFESEVRENCSSCGFMVECIFDFSES